MAKKPKLTSRLEFSKNLGLQIVGFHLIVVIITGMVGLFLEPQVLELLRISLPITAAYFTSILAWMAVADGVDDTRLIGWQSKVAFSVSVYVMFFMLLFVPVHIWYDRSVNIDLSKNFYAIVELIFGGAMGVIGRDFFGHNPEVAKK